jgi:hypothetical protein
MIAQGVFKQKVKPVRMNAIIGLRSCPTARRTLALSPPKPQKASPPGQTSRSKPRQHRGFYEGTLVPGALASANLGPGHLHCTVIAELLLVALVHLELASDFQGYVGILVATLSPLPRYPVLWHTREGQAHRLDGLSTLPLQIQHTSTVRRRLRPPTHPHVKFLLRGGRAVADYLPTYSTIVNPVTERDSPGSTQSQHSVPLHAIVAIDEDILFEQGQHRDLA